jgi:hypothetical protein
MQRMPYHPRIPHPVKVQPRKIPSRLLLFSAITLPLILSVACSKEAPPAPKDSATKVSKKTGKKGAKPPAVKPITLPIEKGIPAPKPLMADQSRLGNKRLPWDNYKAKAPLNARLTLRNAIEANEKFKKDFVGSFVRSSKIPFQLVNRFYFDGHISRDNRAAQVKRFWDYAEKHPTEPQLKANIIVGLTHIGFDAEAWELAKKYKDAAWFKTNAKANFYVGTIPFRSGDYAAALPYLERAHTLEPTPWRAFWLHLALSQRKDPASIAKRKKLFQFGPHMGPSDPKLFHFIDRSKRWGFGRWGLAGSMAFVDFNNDTFIDFLITGTYYSPELYLFKPGVGFERKDRPPLTEATHVVPSVIAADLDNDGYRDVFLGSAAWFGAGPNKVFKNEKGKAFSEITKNGDAKLLMQNSTGLTALDYDRDGLVDIAVSGIKGGSTRLLKNMGNFVFKEVSEEAGISTHEELSIHLCSGDVNGDGWPDIFVNRHGPNALYINQKNGTFKDEAVKRGVAYGSPMGFGTWMFDYDNDGDLDILATNFANITGKFRGGFSRFPIEHFTKPVPNQGAFRPSALFKNKGDGTFEDVTAKSGIVSSSVMGAQFVDLDLDGDLDILLGPGSHPLKNMQPLFVYRNDGDDRFTNITPLSDPRYFGKLHGIAFADVDRDGDPDLYINNGGVMLSDHWRDMFLENTITGRNWLHIGLKGTKSNTSAIGARVFIRVGKKRWLQQMTAGEGFGATNSNYLIFGLNQAKHVDEVEIHWPSGGVQKLPALSANQAIIVKEGSSILRRVY